MTRIVSALLGVLLGPLSLIGAPPQLVDTDLHHLRVEGPREWNEFPERPEAEGLSLAFQSLENTVPWTMQLRQQDVKQAWTLTLNDRKLGQLTRDENDMIVYFAIPAGALIAGNNRLSITQDVRGRAIPDDIRVGEIRLHNGPRDMILDESRLDVTVVDDETGQPLPARITILAGEGALQTTAAVSNETLAVRPGTLYTSNGKAQIGLPLGEYTILAGRGFEYSLAESRIELSSGQTAGCTLRIRREVPTAGYVACDTHIHTVTHSGHGDATVQERMITVAGEGIELPIATDHNVQIDHQPFAEKMSVRQFFTPVIGNEVTTPVGHFNIFPVDSNATPPAYKLDDWQTILDGIYRTPGVKVAILNHARDIHSGVRPFGPALFNDAVGENLDGWAMRFNAMEVLNSSATQTDIRQLFHDWMTLLNRGYRITPVGSSDSHDVARHFVGQGRTYIRCDDRDPAKIDVDAAVNSFCQGRVMVSYGLLAELVVDRKYRSGDIAPVPSDEVHVAVRVLAPHWIEASQVVLYANGRPIREVDVTADSADDLPDGVRWSGSWTIPKPRHDVHLVAIAVGPGIEQSYWKTAKPYQAVSAEWIPHVIGCSGAVWLDVDGDSRATPACDYARRLFDVYGSDLGRLLRRLADYDRSVAVQAAHLVQLSGQSLLVDEVRTALDDAGEEVQAGFQEYLNAWRETQMARGGR